jgi:hypothetical protein
LFFGGFLDQITNYDWKKRYSHLAIGWNVYYVLLTHFEGGRSSGKLIIIKINTESEYNSNLQIGMALSIK